jgi:hypothetical protein
MDKEYKINTMEALFTTPKILFFGGAYVITVSVVQ